MISIKLEGKEYTMPSKWEEVNLELFERIMEHSTGISKYKSEIEYAIEMLSILSGAPKDELLKMTRKSFEDLSKMAEWVTQEVVPSKKKTFVIGDEEYISIENLNTLTMGESVSLELIIKDSNESNILTNILPVLIRRSKTIQRGNGKVKKIPSDFNADEYEELKELYKKNLNVTDVIELRSFF